MRRIKPYARRKTHLVEVGKARIGNDTPILVQSMTNVDTNDVEAGFYQTLRIIEAGGEMVRLTAQGVREAKSLALLRDRLTHEAKCEVPLVADIHFNPKAAYEAAKHVEKVRINPGNFYDPPRKFDVRAYSDQEYDLEVKALQDSFSDFIDHCKLYSTAIRIGVNHGSLSDRIMSRYGDTPEGMVQSCIEFLEVCRTKDFKDVVISIKSSNTLVMAQTVRLLAERMSSEGMTYPLHLGVTEAGEGEDGRLRSAVGIGALLSEGLGDTIRVSLSEPPEAEIPVGRQLVSYVRELETFAATTSSLPFTPCRTPHICEASPLVYMMAEPALNDLPPDLRPDVVLLTSQDDSSDLYSSYKTLGVGEWVLLQDIELFHTPSLLTSLPQEVLPIVRLTYPDRALSAYLVSSLSSRDLVFSWSRSVSSEEAPLRAAFDLGGPLLDGLSQGILLEAPSLDPTALARLSFGLLQASRRRFTRTEFISCPGCGRTLFSLEDTIARVKEATGHLKGLKIGVMGCIVNGPGEMADADYGYVGSAPGKIDLYKSKERVARGIPEDEAVEHLIELIRSHGDWVDPV